MGDSMPQLAHPSIEISGRGAAQLSRTYLPGCRERKDWDLPVVLRFPAVDHTQAYFGSGLTSQRYRERG